MMTKNYTTKSKPYSLEAGSPDILIWDIPKLRMRVLIQFLSERKKKYKLTQTIRWTATKFKRFDEIQNDSMKYKRFDEIQNGSFLYKNEPFCISKNEPRG